ncbi:MAG TPA: insulinase family protein [Candidatus Paceibacterota bacterium]|nr:insulinase family protein [Candidatus Paceibacterota bacterium]
MATDNKPKFQQYDNGLEAVNITNRTLNTSLIGFTVGTRDDPEWLDGAAHLTEHIICRGAPVRLAERFAAQEKNRRKPVTDEEVNRVLRRYLGGSHGPGINIFTMHSHTGYGHADLLRRKYMETVFGTFAQVIRDGMYALRRMDHDKTVLDLHGFRIEKPAVDNETGLNNDDPFLIATKAGMRLLYRTNPARRFGDSEPAQLATVKLGRLKGWAQGHYVPGKMRIVMLGPDPLETEKMIRDAELDQLPAWEPAPRAVVDPGDIVPELTGVREQVIERPGLGMTHVLLLWPTEPFLTPDACALDVLGEVMDGRTEDIVREGNILLPGGVYHPEPGWDATSTHGTFSLWFATRGGRAHADELTGRVLADLKRLPDDDSLAFRRHVQDCRDYLLDAFLENYRYNPGELSELILSYIANGDEELERFQGYRSRLKAVTPEDVRGAARKYLTPDRFVRVVVQPA